MNAIATHMRRVAESLQVVLDFDPYVEAEGKTAAQLRDQARNRLKSNIGGLYVQANAHIGFMSAVRLSAIVEDIQARVDRAGQALESTLERTTAAHTTRLEDLASRSSKVLHEAESALSVVREASGELGVAEHAEFFDTAAAEHAGAAGRWLIATVVMSLATAAAALGAIWLALERPVVSPGQAVQLAFAKLLLFSVLSVALVWCSRNHRSQLHNAVVNRHRRNALSTFAALANATDDDGTRNAVLLRATEAVFLPGSSGYLESTHETGGSATIVEIMKSASAVSNK